MVSLNVEGMTCGHCVSAITKAIQQLDATSDVKINLAAKTVAVNTTTLSVKKLVDVISGEGYQVVNQET
jgi:copper chaperone